MRIGFLASHGGSNARAIIDACLEGRLAAEPAVVISNNSGSSALQMAKERGVPAYHLSSRTHPEAKQLDQAMLQLLQQHGVTLVILAGYMKSIGPATLAQYENRILNIHPSLLPRHGGHGMYGRYVHEAVLAAGDQETGVTVHLVNAVYDEGPIVAQDRVPVLPTDNVESLAARVLQQEHRTYVQTIQRLAAGDLTLDRF